MTIDPSRLSPDELDEYAEIQHYAAIGHVAAKWSRFEHIIDNWILGYGEISPQIGVCIASQIPGHGRKLDAFIALARVKRPKHKRGDDLGAFCKDANGLAEQRNRVVHDYWDTTDILRPRRVEATARRKLRLEEIEVPTDDILNLALNIDALITRFDDMASEIISS